MRELTRSSLRSPYPAPHRLSASAHQCGDERSEHRPEQVGARCGELVGQKPFGVDKVVIGHRVFSLQVELVALLKNHAVAVLIGVTTRPQFQDEWSYTTLLDSTRWRGHDNEHSPRGSDRSCPDFISRRCGWCSRKPLRRPSRNAQRTSGDPGPQSASEVHARLRYGCTCAGDCHNP